MALWKKNTWLTNISDSLIYYSIIWPTLNEAWGRKYEQLKPFSQRMYPFLPLIQCIFHSKNRTLKLILNFNLIWHLWPWKKKKKLKINETFNVKINVLNVTATGIIQNVLFTSPCQCLLTRFTELQSNIAQQMFSHWDPTWTPCTHSVKVLKNTKLLYCNNNDKLNRGEHEDKHTTKCLSCPAAAGPHSMSPNRIKSLSGSVGHYSL